MWSKCIGGVNIKTYFSFICFLFASFRMTFIFSELDAIDHHIVIIEPMTWCLSNVLCSILFQNISEPVDGKMHAIHRSLKRSIHFEPNCCQQFKVTWSVCRADLLRIKWKLETVSSLLSSHFMSCRLTLSDCHMVLTVTQFNSFSSSFRQWIS